MNDISARILEVQAEDYQSCFAQASQLYDQGDYTEALAYYQRALQYQPHDYWAWYRQGSIHEDLGDYGAALQSYQKAVQARPEDYWAWYSLGYIALVHLQRYPQAAIYFAQARTIKPDDYWSVYRQGEALRLAGRWVEAIACYEATLALRPEDYWCFYRLGDAYLGLAQQQERSEAMDSAAATGSDREELNTSYLCEQAFDYYQAALEQRPGDYWAQLQQAHVWECRGDCYRAWGQYRRLHLADPSAERTQYAWACCCARLGDRVGMIRYLEPLLQVAPDYYLPKIQQEPSLAKFLAHPDLTALLQTAQAQLSTTQNKPEL